MSLDFLSKLDAEDTNVSLWPTVIIRNTQSLQIASSDTVLEANTEKVQYINIVVYWMDWREILQG
jgi:hypothetical protein